MYPLNDYNPVAHLYDTYVRVDLDFGFFRTRAAATEGAVLELMAGTGRVSVGILDANPNLTCVDISVEMLRVLRRKIFGRPAHPQVVCADVRSLPLGCRYDLALIPFNSFSELVSEDDRRLALAETWRVLIDGGQLICTLHNPAVRKRQLDDQDRLLGSFEMSEGGRLELLARGSLDPRTCLASSKQTCRILNAHGELVDELFQHVRFALIERDEFESMASSAGFEIVNLVGDYEESAFSENSPFMIWTLQKSV